MFYEIRYQTGELNKVISDMLEKKIPCMDVDNMSEFEWVLSELSKKEIIRAKNVPYDKNAHDSVKEPEFEFRVAFLNKNDESKTTHDPSYYMYIDFYFEPIADRDYDSIFGD
jgi:hypothetical protein